MGASGVNVPSLLCKIGRNFHARAFGQGPPIPLLSR